MAALHRLAGRGEDHVTVGVENGDRTGTERRVEGENQHGAVLHRRAPVVKADLRLKPPRQIAWTSRTSGRKWRIRFWMPCFSVAVEDGQPEQDPCMAR